MVTDLSKKGSIALSLTPTDGRKTLSTVPRPGVKAWTTHKQHHLKEEAKREREADLIKSENEYVITLKRLKCFDEPIECRATLPSHTTVRNLVIYAVADLLTIGVMLLVLPMPDAGMSKPLL